MDNSTTSGGPHRRYSSRSSLAYLWGFTVPFAEYLVRGLGVAMLVVLAGGCAAAGETARTGGTDPLAVLPPCDEPPPAADDVTVPGLALPDGAIITQVTPQAPMTSVNGYIGMTPVQVREHYAERGDLDVLALEDETFEAEILLANDGYRMYLKALARCAEGSSLQVIIAPDVDAGGVPIPDGTPDAILQDS